MIFGEMKLLRHRSTRGSNIIWSPTIYLQDKGTDIKVMISA